MNEPRRLGDSLDRITTSLGAPAAATVSAIFDRWADIVGPSIAAHAQPLSLQRGTLTIGADQPAWAAELAYLEEGIKAKIAKHTGTQDVRRIRVRVTPPQTHRGTTRPPTPPATEARPPSQS